MTARSASLDRERLVSLLTELGVVLSDRGTMGELFIVGGAAMALAYDARRLTTDVDAIFEPKSIIYDAAQIVASRHPEIGADWLNDAAKGFLPGTDSNPHLVLEVPGLRVSVPSTDYLLAMKVFASRVDRDDDDIRYLAKQAGLTTADEVLDVVARFYPPGRIEAKAQFYVHQLFG